MNLERKTTDTRPLLSPAAVAERAGISARTILRLVERGELPAVRFGRCVRIRPEVADRLIEDGTGTPERRGETANAA